MDAAFTMVLARIFPPDSERLKDFDAMRVPEVQSALAQRLVALPAGSMEMRE